MAPAKALGGAVDLYALAIDYDASTNETKEFFQIVQNKLHWAITGSTAAEIVADRASAAKPNMGLTTWKGTKPVLAAYWDRLLGLLLGIL